MPSTEQIVNDVKAILNQIEGETSITAQRAGEIRTDTQAIIAEIASLTTVTQTGFADVTQGLAALIDRENEAIRLLEINDEQNQVALCWLQTLANLACEQLRRLDRQIELQTSIDRSTANVRDILQLVHAREALEVQRTNELSDRIEACCSEEPGEPEPCFEPCKAPDFKRYKRKIQTYAAADPDRKTDPPR